MPVINMYSIEWREIISAIEVADGEGMIRRAQQLIDKIERQLEAQGY